MAYVEHGAWKVKAKYGDADKTFMVVAATFEEVIAKLKQLPSKPDGLVEVNRWDWIDGVIVP